MQPTITNELKAAANEVLIARSYIAEIAPGIKALQQSILDKHKFQYAEENKDLQSGEYLNNTNHLHLISDADFDIYVSEIHEAYINAGYEIVNYGDCPLLVAQNTERKALAHMTDASKYIAYQCGFDSDMFEALYYDMDNLKKYRENILGLVIRLTSEPSISA